MNNPNYKLLGKKLLQKHPEIAAKLLSKPILLDISHMPKIKEFIEEHERLDQKNFFETRETVVAVIMKLYDPDALEGYKNTRRGLRNAIAALYICSPGLISNICSNVMNFIRLYKDFKEDVNYFVETISKMFDDY